MDLSHLGLVHGLWEFDLEIDEEVSELVRSLVEWHTQTFAGHDCVGFEDFTCIILYPDDAAIQVHDGEIDSSQGLEQGDLPLDVEISSLSGVDLIGSNFDDGDNISWLNIRNAISLTRYSVLFAIWASLVNLNGEFFPIATNFLSLAGLAPLLHVDDLSLTAALVTRLSALRIHTWAHLSENGSHTFSFTSIASLNS